MGRSDRRIDVFIEKAKHWQDEIAAIRAILLEGPLDETFKWRQPAYVLDGSVVALIAVRKASCGLSFMRGSLLTNPHGRLVAPGPNSQAARELKFSSLAEILDNSAIIQGTIEDAIRVHRSGERVALKAKEHLSLPDSLKQAFSEDAVLSAAFQALTPGRQRSWIMHIEAAKQNKTRTARIERGRDKIIAGKGQSEY